MKTLNFSKDSEYHSQLNNKVVPFSSCNTTSMVMALKQAGWMFGCSPGEQPEDHLTSFLLSQQSLDKMEELAPWAIDIEGRPIFPPNQVHTMLEWATNLLCGERVDRFVTCATLADIAHYLMLGGGVVMSGVFLVQDRELGHIVSIAGFRTEQDDITYDNIHPSEITHMIIDDPYGDYRTNYRYSHGNNVEMPIGEWNSVFHERGDLNAKWAHLVKPKK